MLRSRSTVSACVANTCCRRRPMRSIRRSTKASGRRSSKAFDAERYSLRKTRARSRPSSESCGPSSAAATAEGMSSLRRRASCVRRATSTERSSTGGRLSARTTAPESFGSASARSQASTSRTSARWKYAAAPQVRAGTARSSSADAITAPSPFTDRTSTAIRSGGTPPAISCSASAATACAWARSERARQKRTRPPLTPVSRPGRTAAAASRMRRPERQLRSSFTTRASGTSSRKRASEPTTVSCCCSSISSRRSIPSAKFASWYSSTRMCWKRAATRSRTCGRSYRSPKARSTRSPKSSAPRSASSRSWSA